jgi:hypothetical protein
MNRRDALKSFIAAPVAAVVPFPAPKRFDLAEFLASPEWTAPEVLKLRDPLEPGEECVVLEYQRFDAYYPPEFGMRTFHQPIGLSRIGPNGIRMWIGVGLHTFTDSGRRDTQGRRIWA